MKNYNFSSKRKAIYDAICRSKEHPSAKNIYNELKSDYPDLSLGTVYRNISVFKAQGKIIVAANVNGEERVDGNLSPHAHFVCTKCGNVYDIFDDKLTSLKDSLKDNDFIIEKECVVFYGSCSKCINKF